jgi:hypothetical protein
MPKKAVSFTIEESNLTWLQGLAARSGSRSVSETVDRLIASARAAGTAAPPRSVVGTIDLAADDPNLDNADAWVRSQFDRSLARPFIAREDVEVFPSRPKRAPKKARRG